MPKYAPSAAGTKLNLRFGKKIDAVKKKIEKLKKKHDQLHAQWKRATKKLHGR